METAGIICEYNPFHSGHALHIRRTREALGGDCAIVCVMSGNFVQRGDFAVFCKHARAETAVRGGADLVVELPSPYALSSAGGFAKAAIIILDNLGVCGSVSFGSESDDIAALREAAEAIVTPEADMLIKEWLETGLPYASAQQRAADVLLGTTSSVFSTPNDLLGIEYLKAIKELGSQLRPVTVKRTGAAHDSHIGCSAAANSAGGSQGLAPGSVICSASALRGMLLDTQNGNWRDFLPPAAAALCEREIHAGRGPVSMNGCELALMSRLRCFKDFSMLPDASEGLDRRFARYAALEPTVEDILGRVKTKRYAMSRLRRMLLCACLGISVKDTIEPPPYIRVLAMNSTGMMLLSSAGKKAKTPIITKPASARGMPGRVRGLFEKEAAATDLYALAYPDENQRRGGQEWQTSPVIISN